MTHSDAFQITCLCVFLAAVLNVITLVLMLL